MAAEIGEGDMCNLYSITTAVEAMRNLFEVSAEREHLGNAEPLDAVWPKYPAPVVRLAEGGGREILPMSWGILTAKTSKKTGKPIAPAAWNNARRQGRQQRPVEGQLPEPSLPRAGLIVLRGEGKKSGAILLVRAGGGRAASSLRVRRFVAGFPAGPAGGSGARDHAHNYHDSGERHRAPGPP